MEDVVIRKSKGRRNDVREAPRRALFRQLYDQQIVDGSFRAGSSAVYDGRTIERQVACRHPFESMRWTEHRCGIDARCTLCRVRSVIAYKICPRDVEEALLPSTSVESRGMVEVPRISVNVGWRHGNSFWTC